MLRKRVITVLTFNDGVLFRTKQFLPDYRYTSNFVDTWSVDEIVALDVTRPGEGDRENFYQIIRQLAHDCFVPLSVGGGVRSLEDVRNYLALGADKVVINSAALQNLEFLSEVSRLYGSQCVIASIDVKRHEDGSYEVFSDFGTTATGHTPVAWAQKVEKYGAGEILLTSIDRDGWLQGYDLELCRSVADAVTVPVIILGGAGNWKHMVDGFNKGHASAVCTQNIYHFTESSILSAKQFLHKKGVLVRL